MQRMLESMQSTENLIDKLCLASRTNLEYFNEHQGFFRAFFLGRDGSNLGLTGAGRNASVTNPKTAREMRRFY